MCTAQSERKRGILPYGWAVTNYLYQRVYGHRYAQVKTIIGGVGHYPTIDRLARKSKPGR
jgi:hypothetical protein